MRRMLVGSLTVAFAAVAWASLAGAQTPASSTPAPRHDTTSNGARVPHPAPNQDQSGVVNTTTGQSTLGPQVTKTTPTQGEPVTAKGDTLSKDTARQPPPPANPRKGAAGQRPGADTGRASTPN